MKEAMPKRARDKYPSYMNDLASTNAIIGKQEKRSDPDGKYRSKWQIHSSDLANYAWTFDRLFYGGFEYELGEIAKRKPDASVLDVMATDIAVGDAIDHGFGYGMAVSLGFPPVRTDLESRIDIVNGDILFRKTWDEITNRMKDRGIEGFDVIIARPEGGLDHLTSFPLVHFRLLQRLWRLLSSDNGLLAIQGPVDSYDLAEAYFDCLRKIYGDTIESTVLGIDGWGYKVALRKYPGAPHSLPTPKMLGITQ